MNDETYQLGSNGHQEMAIRKFEELFDEMTQLMKLSRSVELRFRLAFELHQHRDQELKNDSLLDFLSSRYSVDRKKYRRLLKEFIPEDRVKPYQDAREIFDAVAHGDYRIAMKRIKDFSTKHMQVCELSDEPYGERLITNTRLNDGSIGNIGRFISESQDNLILEDYLLFKHQNYKNFVEILADSMIKSLPNNDRLGWIAEVLLVSRAWKYGEQGPA